MTRETARRAAPRRAWLLAGGMWAAGLALLPAVAALSPAPAVRPPAALPWLAVAACAFLIEMCPVHVEYRRESQRVSLSEVVLTAGLFLVPPLPLLTAYAAGGSAVYFARRRPPVKVFVNGGNLWLITAAAILVFRGLLGPADPTGWRAWCAALAATLLSALLSALLIAAVIRTADGTLGLAQLAHTTGIALAGALAGTTVALTAIVLGTTRPEALPLLAGTWAVTVVMYRSAVRSRERRERLGFLYETARRLHRSSEVEAGLVELLDEAQARLRATVAEVTLLPPEPGGTGVRTTVRLDAAPDVMATIHVPAGEYAEFAGGRADPVVVGPDSASPLALALRARGVGDAVVAPLYDDSGLLGTVLVGNRRGRVAAGFSEDERRLVATLAGQVALGIENGRLERALRQLTDVKERLRHQADHDPLTGLANRALFGRRVEEALATGEPVAVLFLDLDDFKLVNDTLGHAAGDELLVAVAEKLRPCVRETDTPARLGGDEFGICLAGLDDGARPGDVARRLLDALAAPVVLGDVRIDVRASIGIATGAAGAGGAADLLRQADLAMYAAKAGGKSCYEVFDRTIEERVSHRHATTVDLRVAVEQGQFEVHYQPIARVADGSVAGFEALVRWRHPRRGLVLPGEFVELAEDLDLIGDIGSYVLREAAAQVARWRADTGLDLFVSVNVSTRQLRSPRLADEVVAALARHGLPPCALVLEITETAMLDPVAVAERGLDRLKSAGVRIAIDDFGTGYSGLRQLQQLPVDVVKIAKPFVDGLLWEGGEAALALAIVQLGHTLGLGLVAEGVERPEQVARLEAAGCELAQGFFFGRPAPAAEAGRLLAARRPPVPANVIPMQREHHGRPARADSAG